ncbi:MAG: polysaccharide biosynthesis tyrosine autokinase [Bacteroidales bacterium]|nr:polysaccharide biosynthesis tyrosine autokinase [Bacteroidales bacterium]
MNAPISQPHRTHQQQSDDVELQKYFFMFLRNWHWFALAVFMSLTASYLINKNTVKIHKVSATILIEEATTNQSKMLPSLYGGGDILSGIGLNAGWYYLQNQVFILKSYIVAERALKQLDFQVSYFRDDVWGEQEIWNDAPFVVIPDLTKAQPIGVNFKVTFLDDSKLRIESEQISSLVTYYNYETDKTVGETNEFSLDTLTTYGLSVEGEGYSFSIIPRNGSITNGKSKSGAYFFRFNTMGSLIQSWSGRLIVTTVDKDASILNISVDSDCPDKARLYIDTHLNMYLQRTLDNKNKIADSTISFIDKQLEYMAESLTLTEASLEEFRRKNQVVDLSFMGQQLFQQTQELGTRKAELKIQDDYYVYLLGYLSENREAGDLIAPSVMGIADPLLNNLVLELNKMADQKIAMSGTGVAENPYILTLESKIRNAKETLEENTRNLIKNNQIATRDIDNRINSLLVEVSKLPQTERQLFGIERQFKLNDQIYTYLLQRQAEAQIALASNSPDNEIIDTARVSEAPIKPRPVRNYAIALMLGLIIPGLFLIFRDLINNKVTGEDDLKRITDLPVAGHIIHSDRDYQSVVLREPQSQVAEAFRSLRTRLQFFTKTTPSPVVLITSSMAAEGKTFTSINLAAACSLAGKKTVLVGFDLRRPKIYEDFGLSDQSGVSTWLIGRDKLDDIIQESGHENLWIITAGPIPPNPSELASSEKTKELFRELKERFDYIILDSAPMGVVSDTFSLAAVADITIILVRHNKTNKHVLANTLADASMNGLNNISLLMNDISRTNGFYGYGGYYKYGYTYTYKQS